MAGAKHPDIYCMAFAVANAACGRVAFDERHDGGQGATWCDLRPTATYCDDFASGQPAAWWASYSSSRTTFDSPASSPPFAARIVLEASASTCRYARFNKHHELAPATRARFEYSFKLGAFDGDPGFTSALISQFNAIGMPGVLGCGIYVRARANATAEVFRQWRLLDSTFEDATDPIPVMFEADRWTQIAIEMTLSPAPQYTLFVDGVERISMAMDPRCVGAAPRIETNPGYHCQGPETRGLDLWLDDIAIEIAP